MEMSVREYTRRRKLDELNGITRTEDLGTAIFNIMMRSKTVKENLDDDCVICLEKLDHTTEDIVKLHKCTGHYFHKKCINEMFQCMKKCPICGYQYLESYGDQPDGTMVYEVISSSLPGYEDVGTIVVRYSFPAGTRPENRRLDGSLLYPAVTYPADSRTAYLPNTEIGKFALKLLKKSFARRMSFTIGRSLTRSVDNVIVWNVHHKSSMSGGPENYGYPDPTYLERVISELAYRGISDE